MRWLTQFRLRLRSLFGRERVESELAREFEFHLEQQIAEFVASGMSAESARTAALRKFGNVAHKQEQCREERGLHLVESTLQDVRYALRSLRNNPAFTMVAVLTLALGIGANTAIFSLIDSIMLSSLPVKDPSRLVFIETNSTKVGNFQVSTRILNRDIEQMRRKATLLDGIASSEHAGRISVSVDGSAELSRGDFVSGSYFQVLGVPAQIGRTLVPDDDSHNGSDGQAGWPAMISAGYWQRRFGRDTNAIGRRITINTIPFVIVGVMPPGFGGLSIDESADLMVPASVRNQVSAGSESAPFPRPENSPGDIFARLKNGAPQSKAAAELTVLFHEAELGDAHLTATERGLLAKRYIELQSASRGSSFLRQRFAEPLRVLMAVVALIMVIACANIAGLLLARSGARQKEIAIRLSLGCSRARIVRQLLTESMMLSMLGCAVGVLFAFLARDITLKLGVGRRDSPITLPLHWDFRLLAFIALICVLNALLFGVAPALRATRIDPQEVLKSAQTTQHSARLPFGRILVAAQLALSLALVAGSGLFLATLRNLYRIDLGFDSHNLLMASFDPRLIGLDEARSTAVYQELLLNIRRVPGVISATLMNNPLLSGRAYLSSAKFPEYTPQPGEDLTHSWTLSYDAGPKYFSTLGMPLMLGRDFQDSDNSTSPLVVIVNEALVKHYFAGVNPIGRKVLIGSMMKGAKNQAQIIGVVRDAHYFDVTDEHQEALFTPLFQVGSGEFGSEQTLIVKTAGNPSSVAGDVMAVAHRVNPNLALFHVSTMDHQLDGSLSQQRLLAILSTFFGVLALTLSAVGLYGVLAYGVSRRTGEIGIRMALGADRSGILKLIVGEIIPVLALGTAAGVAVTWAGTKMIKSMLFGLSTHDPEIFAISALLLIGAALLASVLPARRATRVDPMVALRYE